MQKTKNTTSVNAHRRVQTTATLSRRYVERPKIEVTRPASLQRSLRINRFNANDSEPKGIENSETEKIIPPSVHPLQASVINKMNEQNSLKNDISAKELKEQAIKKALALASKTEPSKDKNFRKNKLHFGFGRIALASACAIVAVFAIVYFVNLNVPDMSLRVAAIQTGIDAKYPNYIPRGFNITDITSEDGKIVLNFKNVDTDTVFSITEENSSWDSNALLNNFVKEEYGENYTTIKEQGLTIYINNNNATWVNGGINYKIKTISGSLTKKIITTIATSGWK